MDKPFEKAVQGLETGPEASTPEAAGQGGVESTGHPSVAALREKFGAAILKAVVFSGDEHCVYVDAERSAEILHWLRDDASQRYDYLQDLTAIDYGGGRPLEVVYQLWSNTHKRQLRLKVTLPLHALEIDSVYDLWRTSDWLEREVFDLFGIHFRGHPDLRRILMPENYAEGHPLRKDFPLRGRFSRAEQTRLALSMRVEDYYTPDELTIGGTPVAAGDGLAREGRVGGPSEAVKNTTDPMIGGDIPISQRAPVPGGEATQGR